MKKYLLALIFVAVHFLSIAVQPLAAGTYIIGGGPPGFASIKEAADSLNSKGIAGNVVFKILPGIYNEQFSINSFQKNQATDSVIFESLTGNNDVIVHHTETLPDNYVLELNYTSRISFKNITFNSSGNTLEYGIVKIKAGSDFHFFNDKFITDQTVNSGSLIKIELNIPVTNLSITNCYFDGGAQAIYLPGNAVASDGIALIGNTFRNQSGNVITLDLCKGVVLSKNDIECSAGYALNVNQLGTALIVNNKINSKAGGIFITTSNSTMFINPIKIYNNRISALMGIKFEMSGGIQIFHNSIISNSSNTAYAAIDFNTSDSIEIKNNLIINPFENVMSYNNPQPNYVKIDNNCYSSPAGPSIWKFSQAPISADLAAWKINTGFDGQSITCTIPKFVNKDSTTLKLIPGNFGQLKSLLDLSAFVPKDFEGQMRSSNPYYGADEFVYAGAPQSYLRGMITYGAADTVKAGKIMLYADSSDNKRFDVIASAFIDNNGKYEVNNFIRRNYILRVIPDSLQYPNLIPTYFGGHYEWDSATVFTPDSNMFTIKNVDLIQLASYTPALKKISGYVYQDGTNKTNDPIPGLDIILDKIPPAASIKSTKTNADGYYEFNDLSTGDYMVKIDVAGLDKESVISLTLADSNTTVSDLNYCVDSAIYSCTTETKVKEIKQEKASLAIYPNPFSDHVNVVLPNENTAYVVQVYDVLGNQVLTKTLANGGLFELNTTELQSGIYFLKVISNTAVITENKLIKK